MSTYTITGSNIQDHTGAVLTDVDVIKFNTSDTSMAVFHRDQFGDTFHSPLVIKFIGDSHTNEVYVVIGGPVPQPPPSGALATTADVGPTPQPPPGFFSAKAWT